MLLSACVLTRDEPDDLRRALTSLKKAPDEIVVVANHDTSDETEQVTREFNGKLVRYHWNHDFAAARNAGLEAAGGEWIYWIDTDEELLTADRSFFKRLLSDHKALAYYVGIQDVIAGSSARMSERPGQLYYEIELGRSLLLVGDARGHRVLAEAAEQVLAEAQQPRAPLPLVAALLEYALTRATGDCPLTTSQAAELATRWFPNSPPVLWQAARWHYGQGRFSEAAGLLERVLKLGRRGSFDHDTCFDQQVFGDETLLNLGVCWARVGSVDKARRCFRLLAGKNGQFAEAAAANLSRLK